MIIDFHIHYTPEEFIKHKLPPGGGSRVDYAQGLPMYIHHPALHRLEGHLEAMDLAGVDVAVLSSGAGLGGSLEVCRRVNDLLRQEEKRYPGRIRGLAHVPPLGGPAALDELKRAAQDLGFKGAAIASSYGDAGLDSPDLSPFYRAAQDLGLYVFVHPSLGAPGAAAPLYQDYDLFRMVGREFDLVLAVIRLISGGVLDAFPRLRVVISHLGGGIAALMGRIHNYQDKKFWGVADDPRHGRTPKHPYAYYLFERLYFDTGGFFGNLNAINAALLEIPASQLLFGTDYPQEIREGKKIRDFVAGIRSLPLPAPAVKGLLGENGRPLLGL
jgi:predicted TIM-barrel fold metal-dependent hydrolase